MSYEHLSVLVILHVQQCKSAQTFVSTEANLNKMYNSTQGHLSHRVQSCFLHTDLNLYQVVSLAFCAHFTCLDLLGWRNTILSG